MNDRKWKAAAGGEEPAVTNEPRHQLLEVKLLEATMGRFTGRDIFHALEHVTSRYEGR